MANDSLSQNRFASMRKIERWNQWRNRQKEELERLLYIQVEYEGRYADILSFNGWLKAWVNRDFQVEREQIVWEMNCIDQEVMELKRLIQSPPEKISGRWNHHFGN